MRRLYLLLLGGGLCLGLTGCPGRPIEPGWDNAQASYKPILMARSQLEAAVAVLPAQDMRNTGKIYLRDPYIFINERYQGLHIIDNQDPARPQPIAFVRIPGNVDVAMKGNMLYADSGADLLTFDASDVRQLRLVNRVRNAVPELPMPEMGQIPTEYQPANRPADAVVVGWQKL